MQGLAQTLQEADAVGEREDPRRADCMSCAVDEWLGSRGNNLAVGRGAPTTAAELRAPNAGRCLKIELRLKRTQRSTRLATRAIRSVQHGELDENDLSRGSEAGQTLTAVTGASVDSAATRTAIFPNQQRTCAPPAIPQQRGGGRARVAVGEHARSFTMDNQEIV